MPEMAYRPRGYAAQYRQAEYREGKVVRIEQCRRRSHVIELSQSATSSGRPMTANDASSSSSSEVGKYHSRSTSSTTKFEDLMKRPDHVTKRVSSSTRKSTVVIHMPTPVVAKCPKVVFFEQSELPTPPPTPKIERLPTPDLPDLVESAFCDCCADGRFGTKPTTCRCSMQSYYM